MKFFEVWESLRRYHMLILRSMAIRYGKYDSFSSGERVREGESPGEWPSLFLLHLLKQYFSYEETIR